ncbi:MAG: hypothetical protein A2X36_05595 [Elusimicrobia bacterium GWA2_69_24]|nr:MAG: hypothetical protein A2X52_13860 [Candidatus Rokubacteria bacterium GWC2_70_16]OGR57612.1 MAG: hypothetical protein A2X36_05595 [Elusimicrobia bacterium GWA2_69_24]
MRGALTGSGSLVAPLIALAGIGLTVYVALNVIVEGDQRFVLYAGIVLAGVIAALQWRVMTVFLLIAICFEGTLLRTYWTLATTVLFAKAVVAAGLYAGFFIELARRGIAPFRSLPFLVPAAVMFGITLVQTVNPWIPSPIVAVIGFGLFWGFVPMYLVGYYLVESKEAVIRLLLILAVASFPVTVTGIRQYILGPEAFTELDAEVLNDFAFWWIGGESGTRYFRPPATFTFTMGFGLYLLSVLPIFFGLLGAGLSAAKRVVVFAAGGLALVGMMVNGARSFYVLAGLELLVMLVMLRGGRQRAGFVLGGVLLLAGVYPFTWDMFVDRVATIPGNISLRLNYMLQTGPAIALSSSLVGHGAGTATAAARRFSNEVIFPESYWLKLLWEYGLLGTVVFLVLVSMMFWASIKAQRSIRDVRLRWVGVGLLAAVAGGVLNVFVAGPDFTPMNVYFWFFAGVLQRLPELDDSPDEGADVQATAAPRPSRHAAEARDP